MLSQWFRLLPATALTVALFGGCALNPFEPTLESGRGTLTASDGQTATFYFTTLQGVFGSFSLTVFFEGSVPTKYISAEGVAKGVGDVAPADPEAYSHELPLEFASYFLKTDQAPHYAKITVTEITENHQENKVTIGFDWVIQTEAGNRNLS